MDCVWVPVNSAVAGHMTGATTDAANDVRCKVTLFGTVVLAVANTTTVLTNLVLVITESTIQSSELAKLVTLVIVLAFRS